jgi:alpha-L-fucosidase
MLMRSIVITLVSFGLASGSAIAQSAPPDGFVPLFNGRDLTGWQGRAADPPVEAAMSADELATARAAADERMREHWSVENGKLVFDGEGDSLRTARDYDNFELRLDWKIGPGGDSGIYLRGTPQVQIWENPIGSGGLYNNQNHPSTPTVVADNPVGEWNTFRIVMIGDRVSVWLNDINVVENTPLENYWQRGESIAERGRIELQAHGSPLRFRNIFIREIETPEAERDLLREKRMDWWREARFGMFIHWGLYAIPAGEWNDRIYPGASEWLMYTAQIKPKDWEPLVEQFNPVEFDADAWVRLAKRAGMKYIVITSKHHDGFCLFDSEYTDYDIMSTPFKRDIMAELAEACRAHGLRICWYHSILDWHHPDYLPRRAWDDRPAEEADFDRYIAHLKNQLAELVTNYGEIGVLWFDGEWESTWTHEMGVDLHDYVRRLQPSIIINNRVDKGRSGMGGLTRDAEFRGDFGTPEQQVPGTGMPGVDWESCITMNDSWGFKRSDQHWKSSEDLIRMLVDIASKGGNFLLNVGPTALGEIPEASVERLEAMGDWMDVYGESIYGTSASPFRRLPWGRCTQRPIENGRTRLYLHVFDWPITGELTVDGLNNDVRWAYLMGDPLHAPRSVKREGSRLVIDVPGAAPHPAVSVVVLDIEEEPDVEPYIIRQAGDRTVTLLAIDATVHGETARYESGHGKDNIGFWTNPGDSVSWEFKLDHPGWYRVKLEYACQPGNQGGRFRVRVDNGTLTGRISETDSWTDFRTLDVGRMLIRRTGMRELIVEPIEIPNGALMNLKQVRLEPIGQYD